MLHTGLSSFYVVDLLVFSTMLFDYFIGLRISFCFCILDLWNFSELGVCIQRNGENFLGYSNAKLGLCFI